MQRRRDLSLRFLVVGIVLLLVFGIGYASSSWLSLGSGAGFLAMFDDLRPLVLWLFVAIMLLCGLAAAAWMYWGFRLRVEHDPWKYDPELDGPDPRVRRGLEDAEEAPAAPLRPRQ